MSDRYSHYISGIKHAVIAIFGLQYPFQSVTTAKRVETVWVDAPGQGC